MDYDKELLDIQLDLDKQISKLTTIKTDIVNSSMNVGEENCSNYIDYVINELKKCKTIVKVTDSSKVEKTANTNVCFR